MNYFPHLEYFDVTYPELEPLYRQHYGEMQARLKETGVPLAEFNPQLATYSKYAAMGLLLNFVVRLEGKAVGYSNVYITPDMHNGESVATEDTIYVLPEHRGKDAGRVLIDFVHQTLKERGVKRLSVTTATDLKVANWLLKRGYRHTAHSMTICLN